MAIPLPPNPSIKHLKKQAKTLFKAWQTRDEAAMRRIQTHHPQLINQPLSAVSTFDFRLTDAQLVIARDYGFSSWNRLKASIESLTGTLADSLQQFRLAVLAQDVEKVKQLFQQYPALSQHVNVSIFDFDGVDPSVPGVHHSTALDRAAFHGFAEIVRLLLQQPHPPIDVLNEFGGTPLSTAVYGLSHSARRDGNFPATIEALIEAGSKIDPQWLPTGSKAVDALLSKFLNQRETSLSDSTVFDEAVQTIINGNADRLKVLLKQNSELIRARSTSQYHVTLLHYVAANGVEDDLQKTPANAVEIARILLDAGAKVDALADTYGGDTAQTPLALLVSSIHPATAGVQADLVRVLCEAGAAVNGLNDDGLPMATALAFRYPAAADMLAVCGAGVDNLIFAAAVGRLDQVRSRFDETGSLIDQPYRIATIQNEKGWRGTTLFPSDDPQIYMTQAFTCACMGGHIPVAEFLLQKGVGVNAAPRYQQTGLHEAALQGHLDMVKFLIGQGADASIRENQFNGTPAGWADHGGHGAVKNYLLQHYQPDMVDAAAFGLVNRVKTLLDNHPQSANGEDGQGRPLREAASRGDEAIVRLLLENGANPNLATSQGSTALDYALHYGQTRVADLLRQHGGQPGS